MKLFKKKGIATFAAALGLGLAIAASSASAAINWGDPSTLFEDDDVDFHFKADGTLAADGGTLEIGDILVAVLELNDANGAAIGPEELTGLAIIQLLARVDVDGNGTLDDVFGPPTAGFDAWSGGAVLENGAGVAGAGGMLAFWLDGTPDLVIDAGAVTAQTTSCTTYAGCAAQATDGSEWLVAGFTGDGDESWVVLNANDDTALVNTANPAISFGTLNAGLGVINNGTGRLIVKNALSCAPYCGAGEDGFVDIFGSGSVKGGGNAGAGPGEPNLDREWFATSDFDMTLNTTVPVPGTVLLFGLGLLGLSASARRRKV